MNQYATECRSVIYTIQPGDGTRYTFSIAAVRKSGIGASMIYRAEEAMMIMRKEMPDIVYQRIEDTVLISEGKIGFHLSGWNEEETIYLVSIFEPSITCFSVSQSMLEYFGTDNSYLVDYLLGHMAYKINRYTMYVILSFLKEVRLQATPPEKDVMQRALIKAIDAKNTIRICEPEKFKEDEDE